MRPLLLFLLLFAAPALAQPDARTVVTGRVLDAETGAAVPTATVHVAGTYTGTITNADGVFALDVKQLPATLVVRSIGYVTAEVALAAPPEAALEVRLVPAVLELEELVVTDEDPAVNIMRKVIERKQAWRAALDTYRADAYSRFTLRNDTSVVSVVESRTEVFWSREQGIREVVKARRATANVNVDEILSAAAFLPNLYDDDIEIGGHTLVGVTHPDALRHYDFRLTGTRRLDDHTVYDIAVEPKRALTSGFVGRVAVLDEAYALLEVDLRPGAAFIFPPPIERYEAAFHQRFSAFGGEAWFPVDLRATLAVDISFGVLLSFPTIYVDQVSRLTDYATGVALPDSLFAQDQTILVDTAAVRADTLLDVPEWGGGLRVPLSEPERAAYAGVDSTYTLGKAFKPRGLMAGRVNLDDAEEADEAPGGLGLRFTPVMGFNRVEEGRLGLTVGRRFGRLRVQATGGYATGVREAFYGGMAEVRMAGPERQTALGLGFRTGAEPTSHAVYQPFSLSLATLLGRGDYLDYFRNEAVEAWARHQASARRAYRLGLRVERHRSVPKTTDFALGDADLVRRPNPAADEGRLHALALRVALGDSIPAGGLMGGNRLRVEVEQAFPVAGGDFRFTRIEAVLDGQVRTFLRRRFIPPSLDVRLVAGTHLGELPFQRLGALDGALRSVPIRATSFGAFRTRDGRAYRGETYAAVFWEHSFRAVPLEVLGWRWPARKGYNLIVHGAHGRAWNGDAHAADERYQGLAPDGLHHELGVALSGLFGFFRVDATWRLDAPGFTVGLATARIF